MDSIIAHYREIDCKEQLLSHHLEQTGKICGRLMDKIDLRDTGILLGLLHDLGKYSDLFQRYIKSAIGHLDQDADDDFIDFAGLKGKIDHSTAGAQWVWKRFRHYGMQGQLAAQILAVCLASHHGGLMDCLKPDGTDGFHKRITKDDAATHLQECLVAAGNKYLDSLEKISTEDFLKSFLRKIVAVVQPKQKESDLVKAFRLGMLTRFLFSCLIDADRIDSADFENPAKQQGRSATSVDWQIAINRLEKKLSSFAVRNPIDTIRRKISADCRHGADDAQGIFTLSVPTGGGKTLSSMRWAVHHAKKHGLDHIIYIIPYTSIIEQNAGEIKKILERQDDKRPWVLEHHSNLEPEKQTWQSKLSSENWDAPIIFTTMVQFLETLFGGGTRGARRMHSLARAVLIFDEIQCLPVKYVHLFCNGLQFLVDHAKTSALLCTATQPLLDNLRNADKGQLSIPPGNELVPDVKQLFDQLRRVRVRNRFRGSGWSEEEIVDLALSEFSQKGNCLIIVNTKEWARKLFLSCRSRLAADADAVFHLSTNLCPAHRKKILKKIKEEMLRNNKPVLCVSTQLIEAGVDVDFNSVIRFLAGLDSIAQAAGRCNRNGRLPTADVHVVNPAEESIDSLDDIRIGKDKAQRIFSEEHDDYLSPEVMQQYFFYYFYSRAKVMTYPLTSAQVGRNGESLLNLLAHNPLNVGRKANNILLQQSFKTAGRLFQAIDAPTRSVIVPYGVGREIIGRLCAAFEPTEAYDLLRKAQRYSVNVFPNIWKKLRQAGAVIPIQENVDIWYLDEQFYENNFGLSTEIVSVRETTIV